MKTSNAILLGTLLLAACGPGKDNKPVMEQQIDTLNKAKQVDGMMQQQAQQQKQEMEKQGK